MTDKVLANIKAIQDSVVADLRNSHDCWATHESPVKALLALDLAPFTKTMAKELISGAKRSA
jgi:hypothetical protein